MFFFTLKWILGIIIKAAATSALALSPPEFMGENFNSYLGPYNKRTCPHFIDGETEVHGGLATGPRELEFEFRSVCSAASHITLVVKNMPANARDVRDAGLIPGLGRSLGGRHSNSLQYSCLEHPTDRGAWQDAVHSVASNQSILKEISPEYSLKRLMLKLKMPAPKQFPFCKTT